MKKMRDVERSTKTRESMYECALWGRPDARGDCTLEGSSGRTRRAVSRPSG